MVDEQWANGQWLMACPERSRRVIGLSAEASAQGREAWRAWTIRYDSLTTRCLPLTILSGPLPLTSGCYRPSVVCSLLPHASHSLRPSLILDSWSCRLPLK